jgi:hypothetical protein
MPTLLETSKTVVRLVIIYLTVQAPFTARIQVLLQTATYAMPMILAALATQT